MGAAGGCLLQLGALFLVLCPVESSGSLTAADQSGLHGAPAVQFGLLLELRTPDPALAATPSFLSSGSPGVLQGF